ncbi:alpha-ketoacid dehydrogenase subunit beta [Dactylosporangium sp. NBC_01737]|uniref:alpha-ketoacid dehydrogenase subunit beta n=1 Tax=Dactylosporangium sp. NBC_01737 TaxID=2975959 RepID=UPI002E109F48|nr:alpha-ketoacid dehydrogenase subunit beta [Dactylosporangium sp. NBC_01737]
MNAPRRVGDALNAALGTLLAEDPALYLLGEDIADPYGGAFGITRGLSTRFPRQVITTPISEAGIVGVANGLALAGDKVIVEMMFADFVALAFDQIVNFAAKSTTMYGHPVPMPVVVRCPTGGNRGYGPTHSQSPQKHFIGVPGLDVYELTPYHDPADLLREMLGSGRPALLFEDKTLYTAPLRDALELFPAAPPQAAGPARGVPTPQTPHAPLRDALELFPAAPPQAAGPARGVPTPRTPHAPLRDALELFPAAPPQAAGPARGVPTPRTPHAPLRDALELFAVTHTGGFAAVRVDDDTPADDYLLVTPGGPAGRATAAMRTLLLRYELSGRLLVPARLHPLDIEPLLPLAAAARRVLVVEDGPPGAAWGTEVAYRLQQALWGTPSGPVRLVQAADAVIPTAAHLERGVLVQQDTIVRAVLEADPWPLRSAAEATA